MAGAVAHDHDARAREKEEENIKRGTHGAFKALDNKPVAAGTVTPNRLAYSVGKRKSENPTTAIPSRSVKWKKNGASSMSLPVVVPSNWRLR